MMMDERVEIYEMMGEEMEKPVSRAQETGIQMILQEFGTQKMAIGKKKPLG